jgi:probable HAF family extracellular repeat protein
MVAKLLSIALMSVGMSLPFINGVNAQPLYSSYAYKDLGTVAGGEDSFANAINNAGQVVGFSYVDGNRHATSWNGTTATDLGILAGSGTRSEAWAINEQGTVAGFTFLDGKTQAATWSGTTVTGLDTPSGSDSSYALGINDSGRVAGRSSTNGDTRAVIWNGTTATSLNTPNGNSGIAYAINDEGKVAGRSIFTGSSTTHATVWDNASSTPTDLGTLPGGATSTAFAINAHGQVAGRSSFLPGSFDYHATVWNGNVPTDLGTLDGDSSEANAINNAGVAVGWSDTADGDTRAALWTGTAAIDLNTFLDGDTVNDGWVLVEASGINDQGWIVGDAYNSQTQQTHAFLLTPVPEPGTYAMLLFGLGLMGIVVRRKKIA